MIKHIQAPDVLPNRNDKDLISPKVYRPDFREEQKIFQITEMNNVIDIMNRHPKYQQAIMSNMPVVDDASFVDTSSFSDSQLVDSCIERQFDNNELSEFAENDLKNFKNNKL